MSQGGMRRVFFVSIWLVFQFFRVYSQQVNHWESIVSAEDQWEYFAGTSEPPSGWNALWFDASDWAKGPGGIGYGDNDDRTVIPAVTSVYLRHIFNIPDPSKIVSALLYVDFDDGFVAYLNGVEIARVNMGISSRPSYSQFAVTAGYEAKMPSGGIPSRFVLLPDQIKSLKKGNNVLALQVHNSSPTSDDLSSSAFLVAGIADPGTSFQPLPAWFLNPDSERSHLPLVVIDTYGQTILDEPKITAGFKVIDHGQTNSTLDPGNQFDGVAGIEIRGQSSQTFPKKSYTVEIRDRQGEDVKVGLMGMPAESDWVLYAPYSDKTMLRNALTYHLGAQLGRWQPRFRFCEVYLNGSYIGVYQLTEKIKRDKNRVNISKMDPSDISGEEVTGGYILKVDKTTGLSSSEYFNNVPDVKYLNTRVHQWTYVYPKPEEMAKEQKAWIKNYIKTVENTINGSSFANPSKGYSKYIDVPSFIDFQIMNELPNNVDAYRFSAYFHKEDDSEGGKLKAGPLWDFDLGYGNVNYSPENLAVDQWDFNKIGSETRNCLHWWARLMKDPDYVMAVKKRWSFLRKGVLSTDSIMNFIDDQVLFLGDAVGRNFKRWPILGTYIWPNSAVRPSYSAEISFLKDWILGRLAWMDRQWLIPDESENRLAEDNIKIYPNPFAGTLNIGMALSGKEVSLTLYDIRGVEVFSLAHLQPDYQTYRLDLSHLQDGLYILRISGGNETIVRKIVKGG